MAYTLSIVSQSSTQRAVTVYGTIALSGSYVSGGEAIPASAFKSGSSKKPYIVGVVGKAGQTYQYDVEAEKLKCFAGATETTAGAYPAGVTGDVIRFAATFPKFG